MSVIVSARNGMISEVQKNYAKESIEALIGRYHKITSARIILSAEKARYKAEVIIHGKNINVEADYESLDMRESIDTMISKADKQLRRHFDKVQNHHKAPKLSQVEVIDTELDEEELEEIALDARLT